MKKNKAKGISVLLATLFAATALMAFAPASVAYGGGPANWQLTISQTGVIPGTQLGFGIWGWCDLSGSSTPSNPTSGTSGDCQATIYSHAPASLGGDLTCHVSIDITSWGEAALGSAGFGQYFGVTNDLVAFTGTQTITPHSSPLLCGPSGPIVPTDLTPAQPGHYNGNSLVPLFAEVGDFQMQVTQTSK